MSSKIIKVHLPKIKLDTISFVDIESDQRKGALKADGVFPSKHYGKTFPIVQINGKKFEAQEIVKFELDVTGVIPKIDLVLQCFDSYFISKKFPRDNGKVSIFISSEDDSYTPIRNDYLITSISSNDNSGKLQGEYSIIRISGVLDIPQWTGEINKSIVGDSLKAMNEISKDLNLGFASNVKASKDTMTWICPYDTYEKFAYDITRASYAGENSFFGSFIDQYYFLNFIDMNLPYSEELTVENGLLVDYLNQKIDNTKDATKSQGQILLTNVEYYQSTNFFINKYSLLNNSGARAGIDGYQRILQFYDLDTNQKYEIPIDSLITSGNQNKDTLSGDDKTKELKKKYIWLGCIDTENMHDNYMWAQVHNYQNEKHIGKMQLQINLSHVNFNLYRGMRVPVMIVYSYDQAKVESEKDTTEDKDVKMTTDKFLSGYYVITGIKYKYDNISFSLSQELILSRREWPKIK